MHSKYLIIGAGISGLTFANMKSSDDYYIIEQADVPGGLARSFRDSGFIWDVAGHFFHFHSESTKAFYEKMMSGRTQRTVQKCAKVFYGGCYIDAPFQYNIHQLSQDEFLECLTDLYYAHSPKDDIPFDEYVRQQYGAGISNKFLIPYNEKLYACKMNELERNSMGCFLPKLDFDMLMSSYTGLYGKTYNDTFNYPTNGCDEIIAAFLSHLDYNRISLGERVVSVDTIHKVVKTNKDQYSYDFLINTVPLNMFAKMIGEDSSSLTFNKVLVLNIGFDKPSLDKRISWIYFPGDEIFYRVGFYNNIAGTEKLSIYVEISYRADDRIDIDFAMNKTLEDLKRVRIIDNHSVVAQMSFIINPGYVHITKIGSDYTERLIASLENHNVFMIGRYARWQYSAMDDSIEQAIELSKNI